MSHSQQVHGIGLDSETRCIHYHTPLDVVAIKFKCCGKYYACIHCHNESEDHAPIPWSKEEYDTHAILCGVCGHELTIAEYTETNHCPHCNAPFNPRCEAHYPHYFEI
ncbi:MULTISPECIES: CHY zinc finger protein [Staphylococcus]|uniref:CHY zinc finger protein n=1 Tax=Staphylococcus TaxID=1279 RepID=UPI0021CFE8DF|nr:CHY zinc finger protein [Staphylococcus sp. IVB6181]UXV34605.1 CHY zinc finger protein [Staphylococcus sp. IVB6181]